MKKIITTTEVQQKIGEITATIDENYYIVTNRGKGKFIILPYIDGCDEILEDFIEDLEILQNKEKLQKQLQESLDSGDSDLVI